MARPDPTRWHRARHSRLLPWPRPRRPRIRPRQCPRRLRTHPPNPPYSADRLRAISQGPLGTWHQRPHPEAHSTLPLHHRQGYAPLVLDADALRRYHRARFLSRRTRRPVRCALHHGKCLHRIRHSPYHHSSRRADMDAQVWAFAGILRQCCDRRVGLHQHIY